MPRRTLEWDESKITRFIKDKRGQGEGAEYKPWLTTHDITSGGRKHRLKSWKTNRGHYLFSDLEANSFYYLNWIDEIIDIREHFPILDRKKTIEIAEEYQIKYPTDPHTQTPLVICTDFLITVKQKNRKVLIARSVIYSNELEDTRKLEKLKIEFLYWRNAGVNWGIITEYDIPKPIVDNLKWVYNSYWLSDSSKETYYLLEILKRSIQTGSADDTLGSFLSKLDKEYSQKPGTFLALAKHLIVHKILKVDFHKKVNPSLPLSEFTMGPNILEFGDLNVNR